MKFVRYEADGQISYGQLDEDGTIHALRGCPFDVIEHSGDVTSLDQVELLAPVEQGRIIGVGLNYAAHAAESGKEEPEMPMLFMLPFAAVIAPEAPIIYPSQGRHVDFEGELAVIIGHKTRRVSEADALDRVFGYACGNDLSERVIQRREMAMGAMLICKSFDTFKPLGPCIATGLDPTNLELTTRLNGEIKQHSSTSDMIFPVAKLVAYISEALTLLPGDVIMSGTPSGVGPVQSGDTVEIEISGIGLLRNPVIAE